MGSHDCCSGGDIRGCNGEASVMASIFDVPCAERRGACPKIWRSRRVKFSIVVILTQQAEVDEDKIRREISLGEAV